MGNNQEFKYIIYKTTNIVNNKIYIGVHKTSTPYEFDNYLGCGSKTNVPSSYNKGETPFHRAILKYGVESFKRETLEVYDTLEEALNRESEIVNSDFIKLDNNYNAIIGGGVPPRNDIEIYQFDLNGNFLKKWESESAIKRYFKSSVLLTDIIRSKRNFAGYFWAFNNSIDVKEYKRISYRNYIDQYDSNGKFIKSYKRATMIAEEFGESFDKINRYIFRRKPYKGYYFLNSGVDIKEVLEFLHSKKLKKHSVFRYKDSGELDKEYESINKAVKDLEHGSNKTLKKSITEGKLYNGYYWSYVKMPIFDKNKSLENLNYTPRIYQYDKEGNLIKIWDDYKECKKKFPYCLEVCRGKSKSTAGYVFKYQD